MSISTAGNARPVPRPGIMDIAAYVPGDPGEGAVRAALAANEGALGPSPRAVAAAKDCIGRAHRYPDGGAVRLREAIAAHYGLEPGRIVVGAGSDELIQLLIRAYAGPGDEVLCGQYSFLIYRLQAMAAGAGVVLAPEPDLQPDVDALLARVSERTRLVFVAHPNNPTGTMLEAGEIERLRAGLPDHVLLVVDAAYAEYAPPGEGYNDGIEMVRDSENTVCLRTFSKVHALAGLRVGWGYFPEQVAAALNRIRCVFNVTTAGQAAAIASLEDSAHLERTVAHTARLRGDIAGALVQRGADIIAGPVNFIVMRCGDATRARQIHDALAAGKVMVRPLGGYGLADCLRITIGTDEEMQAFLSLYDGIAA